MVKGVQHKSLRQEAISELVGQSSLYPKVVYPKYVGDFLAYVLTGDKVNAKLVWVNTLRARSDSTCMDTLYIQELDDMLEDL